MRVSGERQIWVGTCDSCQEETLCEMCPESDRDQFCSVCSSTEVYWEKQWIPNIEGGGDDS